MKKKLKLRIVKFTRRIAVELLEMEGKFNETKHIKCAEHFDVSDYDISLPKNLGKRTEFDAILFRNEKECSQYLAKIIYWITDEQFGGIGELEVGTECLLSIDGIHWGKHKLLAILPEEYEPRYIAHAKIPPHYLGFFSYAKSLTSNEPLTTDGEVYTWEADV